MSYCTRWSFNIPDTRNRLRLHRTADPGSKLVPKTWRTRRGTAVVRVSAERVTFRRKFAERFRNVRSVVGASKIRPVRPVLERRRHRRIERLRPINSRDSRRLFSGDVPRFGKRSVFGSFPRFWTERKPFYETNHHETARDVVS